MPRRLEQIGLLFRLGLVVRGRCGSPRARPLIRHSAIMARAAKDAKLKRRALTKLYNERPTWRKPAHRELDAAVLAAYAATDTDGDWREDWADARFDTGAGQPLPERHPLTDRRAETDRNVEANLRPKEPRAAGGRAPTGGRNHP